MLPVYGVMFHLFQEIFTKKTNWLRLRWLRQRQAEAETETSHLVLYFTFVDEFTLGDAHNKLGYCKFRSKRANFYELNFWL